MTTVGDFVTKTPHLTTILVPGASGRLGRLLRGAQTHADPSRGRVIFADRAGANELQIDANHLPSDLPPCDAVIALWGVTSGEQSDLQKNVQLAKATKLLAKLTGASRVFHMSSAGVYGPGHDLNEMSRTSPTSAYGDAKLQMEAVVEQFKEDDLHHCCLRLANVVGADSLAPGLRAQGGTPVTLTKFVDGRGPLRSYIAPCQLLHILQSLAKLPPSHLPPVLNVAASTPVEMEALAHAAGKEVIWKPATPKDRQNVTLSTKRLASLLPELALHKTASEMIADWQRAETYA